MNKLVFFRNDDVRGNLDEALVSITYLLAKTSIPISHTIEPANITNDVIDWIKEFQVKHPNMLELVQHGYAHRLNYQKVINGKLRKGEFGGDRTYEEQFAEIYHGKELMDQYFGSNWFPLFTFPYGARNDAALKAVSDAGFVAVNGSMGVSVQHQVLYFFGRLFNQEMLWDKKISYHLRHRKGLGLFQIDTSFSLIKKYKDEGTEADFYSLEQLKLKAAEYLRKAPTVGIVLHHRYHNTPEKLKLLEDFVVWLKSQKGIEFVTQEEIYKKFAK